MRVRPVGFAIGGVFIILAFFIAMLGALAFAAGSRDPILPIIAMRAGLIGFYLLGDVLFDSKENTPQNN